MRQGRFELADGGTIFLDEIGDLPQEIQVKFLRVLQEGEFERVGSSRSKKVDVRVIAATHHNLEAAVAEGRFRADLYYRLSVYPIHLPSLQERVDDIPRLVWFFIHRHQRDLGTAHHQSAAVADGRAAALRVARQRSRAGKCGGARHDRVGRATPCSSTLPWRFSALTREQAESVGQSRRRAARAHRERPRAVRLAHQRNGQYRRASGHPPEHPAIPHEEAGRDVSGWPRPAPAVAAAERLSATRHARP